MDTSCGEPGFSETFSQASRLPKPGDEAMLAGPSKMSLSKSALPWASIMPEILPLPLPETRMQRPGSWVGRPRGRQTRAENIRESPMTPRGGRYNWHEPAKKKQGRAPESQDQNDKGSDSPKHLNTLHPLRHYIHSSPYYAPRRP